MYFLLDAAAQPPGRVRADDVEEADQPECHHGDVRRHAAVGEVRGQVDADEHDLEPADEEAERQQHVAAMRQRLGHRLAGRLPEHVPRRFPPLDHRGRERHDHQRDGGERQKRAVPADARQQPLRERQHRELAERAGGRRDAERHAPFFGREPASKHARDDAERDARQARADQHAGRQHEEPRRGGVGHQREPARVQEPAAEHHARRAEAVGDHAGERLREAPDQILHGDRQREGLASPAHFGRDRLQEEPEAVPDAHRERQDEAAADENDRGSAPIGGAGDHRVRSEMVFSPGAAAAPDAVPRHRPAGR